MLNAILSPCARKRHFGAALFSICLIATSGALGQAQAKKRPRGPTGGGEATLEADQQRAVGKIFHADGHVDVRYQNARVRADHVEYDSEKQVEIARGRV